MNKVAAIRLLMDNGLARDVLELIEGESEFTSDESSGVPDHPDLKKLWVISVHHLRFVVEFGQGETSAVKGGKFRTPFPREFEQWLQAGAPGVASADVDACLRGRLLSI
jgi:hypothetical protein